MAKLTELKKQYQNQYLKVIGEMNHGEEGLYLEPVLVGQKEIDSGRRFDGVKSTKIGKVKRLPS